MGLDSVELIVEFEKYFSIQIPNASAEKIGTVQDSVNCISSLRNITDERPLLRERVFADLVKVISDLGFKKDQIGLTDLVFHVFPDNNKQIWQTISKKLGLEIPMPPQNAKWQKRLSWRSSFDYDQLTFSALTDVICGNASEKLIDRNNISTSYEVYIAIMAITVEMIGVDFYEINPEKTFTGDLGID